MKTKIKLKNKFDERKARKGTIAIGESKTNIAQREDSDIYCCLQKYGMSALLNQTQAKEFLYVDNTNRNMTLDEAIRQRNQLSDYFKQQPARVRKVFGDNVDNFIEKYKRGEFDEFLTTGVLSKEQINELTLDNNISINKENVSTTTQVEKELINE